MGKKRRFVTYLLPEKRRKISCPRTFAGAGLMGLVKIICGSRFRAHRFLTPRFLPLPGAPQGRRHLRRLEGGGHVVYPDEICAP